MAARVLTAIFYYEYKEISLISSFILSILNHFFTCIHVHFYATVLSTSLSSFVTCYWH